MTTKRLDDGGYLQDRPGQKYKLLREVIDVML